MTAMWTCPKCNRHFTHQNQRQAYGTGDRPEVLRNREPAIVGLYNALETFAKSLGSVEFVTRDRYVLLRSNRIFADLTVRPDALRLVIHLSREARHPLFEKIVSDRRQVSHVAKVRAVEDLEAMKPFLREAYEYSVS